MTLLLADKLAEALEDRSPEIVGRLVATYRHNPGYEALDAETYEVDLLPVATANERLLCRRLRGLPHDSEDVRIIAESAVRRFAQGVPESEVMRAYRLWSMAIWTELTEIARTLKAASSEELVELAAVVLEHNEFAGGLAADAYEAEQHGIWIDSAPIPAATREQILNGNVDPEVIDQLEADRLPGSEPVTLLLVAARSHGGIVAEKNSAVRAVVDDWRRECGNRCLVLADGRVVLAIGRAPEAHSWSIELSQSHIESVAMAIAPENDSLAAAVAAYRELIEVLKVADLLPPRARPLTWRDTLLGSILNSAPTPVKSRLADVASTLLDYETRHSTPLHHTFSIFLESELSITASAASLFCHPNTVRYRLSRIKALCGLDPWSERDRSILSLALMPNSLSSEGEP